MNLNRLHDFREVLQKTRMNDWQIALAVCLGNQAGS